MTTTLAAGQALSDIDRRLIDMRSKTIERMATTQARLTEELEGASLRHRAERDGMESRHKKELDAIRDEYTWFQDVLAEQEADISAVRGDDSTVYLQAAE